eukprot:Plantae.Rhodophyta-Purpureofilum_apyrenoidigerum.ctg45443.p1 GENE.Plantae.Rhodophyta-Purpureofilum_apyrenoidigerum.ctg45443~~Plantae.Rhodophyta-Purpureofilum_apyrenoidigerum.ctg45443.p1  ORF type:complete len:324 (-),score=71.67 Plantae.Rhodophyta-Purpureofilum_apyrenoidigerum.ctg45443:148-1119(-)
MAGAADWDDEEPVFDDREEDDEDEKEEEGEHGGLESVETENHVSSEAAFVSPAPASAIVGAGLAGMNSMWSGEKDDEKHTACEPQSSRSYWEPSQHEIGQTMYTDFESAEDNDEEDSLMGPVLRMLFAAATVLFTVSVGNILLERRKQLVREYSEHLVFAQSTTHVRDLINEFRKKLSWLPSGFELFQDYIDLSLTERPVTVHTILDMREAKTLLNISDRDVIKAFRCLHNDDRENERMAQMRFVSERLVPAASYDCLEFLRSMPTSIYARIERDMIDSCRAADELGIIDSAQRDDILQSKIRRRVRSMRQYNSRRTEELFRW